MTVLREEFSYPQPATGVYAVAWDPERRHARVRMFAGDIGTAPRTRRRARRRWRSVRCSWRVVSSPTARHEVTIDQGVEMGRPSRLTVTCDVASGRGRAAAGDRRSGRARCRGHASPSPPGLTASESVSGGGASWWPCLRGRACASRWWHRWRPVRHGGTLSGHRPRLLGELGRSDAAATACSPSPSAGAAPRRPAGSAAWGAGRTPRSPRRRVPGLEALDGRRTAACRARFSLLRRITSTVGAVDEAGVASARSHR